MIQNENIVVIMAGGLGKRMNSDLPKVLHKIGDKPMLLRCIQEALLINPFKILILVGKYKDIIESTLKEYIDIEKNKIEFIIQSEALGTGHAIQCCRNELLKYNNYNVIILSGDTPLLTAETIQHILKDFVKVKIVTTLLENPHGYGRIIEKNGFFEKIVEEKDCILEERQIQKVNCGIYVFNSNILCNYLPFLTNKNAQNEYYLTDIVEIVKKNENIFIELYNIPIEKQIEITGVNTIEQLHELENKYFTKNL